jgi:hypothetical protein
MLPSLSAEELRNNLKECFAEPLWKLSEPVAQEYFNRWKHVWIQSFAGSQTSLQLIGIF